MPNNAASLFALTPEPLPVRTPRDDATNQAKLTAGFLDCAHDTTKAALARLDRWNEFVALPADATELRDELAQVLQTLARLNSEVRIIAAAQGLNLTTEA